MLREREGGREQKGRKERLGMRKKKGDAKAGELTHVRQGSLEKVRLAPRPVRYPSIESGQLANG